MWWQHSWPFSCLSFQCLWSRTVSAASEPSLMNVHKPATQVKVILGASWPLLRIIGLKCTGGEGALNTVLTVRRQWLLINQSWQGLSGLLPDQTLMVEDRLLYWLSIVVIGSWARAPVLIKRWYDITAHTQIKKTIIVRVDVRDTVPGGEADLNMSCDGLGSMIQEDGEPEPPSDWSCKETEVRMKLQRQIAHIVMCKVYTWMYANFWNQKPCLCSVYMNLGK